MSREIKFRSWVENDRIKDSIYPFMNYRIEFMGGAINDIFATSGQAPLNPLGNKITYMQYTGLKDINGVEIYEGDALSYWGFTYIVSYQDAAFGWVEDGEFHSFASMAIDEISKAKIIGNIFETPELLEVQK